MRNWFLSLCACGAFVAASSTAAAEHPMPREFDLGVGAFFNAGGSFLTEPSSDLITLDGQDVKVPTNGFAGFSPGGGVGFEFRYRGVVGLELDLIQSSDHAETEMNDVRITIDQSALHIPILLKGVLPAGSVRPNLFVGIELVYPDAPETKKGSDSLATRFAAHTDSYLLYAFGLGIEFLLPIDGVDLRIPFNLRGSINPNTSDNAEDRAKYEIAGPTILEIDYNSEWEYHAAITLGLFYHFL